MAPVVMSTIVVVSSPVALIALLVMSDGILVVSSAMLVFASDVIQGVPSAKSSDIMIFKRQKKNRILE
jgi:hypothetical protein